jgi:dUTP pyrophosphatase|tara:strand:+ start:210 stop:674 length:465 start_codon:yes stop_codon:yes gene_type:complete
LILEYYSMPWGEHKPLRANPSDAGLDLRFNPQEHTLVPIQIQPGESLVLGTGLKFGVPHGYMIQIMNRSGNAAKKQLMVGACVVDSGYNGEVFVNLHNIGSEPQTINPGDKIAQAVVIPVVPARFVETSNDNLYDWWPITISGRGDGALGSTGD